MPIRVAATGVGHWHSLYDSAYLRHLAGMPDMQLVALQDPSAEIAAHRAAALGGPRVYTDYRRMLTETRPDFVIALGRHSSMAETALFLVDQGYPFVMEKPMGLDADEVRRVADRAAAKNAFVAVPLGLVSATSEARRVRARELLERVDLLDRAEARPAELSGGEQQRIALCAALANRPRLLIADEPTGDLDAESARAVLALLAELVSDHEAAAVVVSHDPASTDIADRVVHIRDGRVSARIVPLLANAGTDS